MSPGRGIGKEITGYTILERAGLIAAPSVSPEPESVAVPPSGEAPSDALEQVRSLIPRLLAVLGETDAEFNRLPVFVRPVARRGFKNKTGQSHKEWNQTLRTLAAQVDTALASGPAARANLCRQFSPLADSLSRLIVYYEEVPSETARMTKDVDFLQEVARISKQRTTLVRALIDALERAV